MNVSILVKDGKRCDTVHTAGAPDSNPEHLLNLTALPDSIPDLKNQFYQQVFFSSSNRTIKILFKRTSSLTYSEKELLLNDCTSPLKLKYHCLRSNIRKL